MFNSLDRMPSCEVMLAVATTPRSLIFLVASVMKVFSSPLRLLTLLFCSSRVESILLILVSVFCLILSNCALTLSVSVPPNGVVIIRRAVGVEDSSLPPFEA